MLFAILVESPYKQTSQNFHPSLFPWTYVYRGVMHATLAALLLKATF